MLPVPGVLQGVDAGHCPMDEAPEAVNPLVERFVRRHVSSS